ncbi:MAG TPA: class I SAM-dependent methyltransferase [Bdellovibrionota bacterium]|nr:class I SAM-dependent methyltransferase [Bdellovibrionota bacterium]
MQTDYSEVSEANGQEATHEQIQRLFNRYSWVASYCHDKDIVEVACGTGFGLGLIQKTARSLVAGDISPKLVQRAKEIYGNSIQIQVLDAQNLPFENASKDIIAICEAIYYIPSIPKFLGEAKRILRKGGFLLIVTANKDLYDFNPSQLSLSYLGVRELSQVLNEHGFEAEFFGDSPVNEASIWQKVLRPAKKLAVMFNLIPKSMVGKRALKRIVFGKLEILPQRLDSVEFQAAPPSPLTSELPDRSHKVLFCAAQKL